MNAQTRTASEVLVVLFVALSITTVITLSLASENMALLPVIVSGTSLAVVMIATASIMGTGAFGAPWVPTRRELVKKALEAAEIKPGELLYDLGSGDGRIVITAAKEFGARAVGVEIDPLRVLYSRLRIRTLGMDAKIIQKNFFKVDLRNADIVIMYLVEHTNEKLKTKLEKELKPTSRVVSIVWKFQGWPLFRSDDEEMIYVYKPGQLYR